MTDSLKKAGAGDRTLRLVCQGLFILSPFLVLLLISLATSQNAFAAYPVWSNELDCWRGLFNWNAVGFSGGYTGSFEALPLIGNMGAYGLTPVLLYGWFVKLFGLSPFTILWCNALWVSLGALTLCLLHRPKPFVSLTLTALFAAYTPVILYICTSMTELFSYAAVLFYLAFLLKYRQTKSPWMLGWCVLTVLVASFYRITFFPLFFPLAWLYGGSRVSLKSALASALLLVLSVGCYALSAAMTAPNTQGFLYNFLRADSLETALQMLLSHTKSNVIDYVNFYHVDHVQWAFRRLYWLVMLLCALSSFLCVRRQNGRLRPALRLQSEPLACLMWMCVSLAIIMTLFETNNWADFRILAPVCWLAPVYLLMRGKRALPLTALAAALLLLIPLAQNAPVGAFADSERFTPPAREERLTSAMAVIAYDPEAEDPFENTVRTDLDGWELRSRLEAGLGMECGWFTPENVGKSRWILTDTLKIALEGYEPVLREHDVAVYRLAEP